MFFVLGCRIPGIYLVRGIYLGITSVQKYQFFRNYRERFTTDMNIPMFLTFPDKVVLLYMAFILNV